MFKNDSLKHTCNDNSDIENSKNSRRVIMCINFDVIRALQTHARRTHVQRKSNDFMTQTMITWIGQTTGRIQNCVKGLNSIPPFSYRPFLQRVSIACYAERCISYDRFCPTV